MPKTLEELKKENKELEDAEKKEPKDEVIEDDDVDDDDDDLDLDKEEIDDDDVDDDVDDDEDDEDKTPLEPWMDTEDPSKKEKGFVPVAAHVEVKNKLRGRLNEKDEELEKLKEENRLLKQNSSIPVHKEKPNSADYTDQAEYDQAMEEWKDYDTTTRLQRINAANEQAAKKAAAKKELEESVDSHYTRGAKLVTESGISPDLFKQTDLKVRKTIEKLRPGLGDLITDNLIATVGEGSEKVMYYLGVNETALNKLQALLINDPSGMKAAVFLGQEKQRLITPKKQQSNAPKPAKNLSGDSGTGNNAKSLKRKYDLAHKKGDVQAAYKIKQKAKKGKIDTSGWIGE